MDDVRFLFGVSGDSLFLPRVSRDPGHLGPQSPVPCRGFHASHSTLSNLPQDLPPSTRPCRSDTALVVVSLLMTRTVTSPAVLGLAPARSLPVSPPDVSPVDRSPPTRTHGPSVLYYRVQYTTTLIDHCDLSCPARRSRCGFGSNPRPRPVR